MASTNDTPLKRCSKCKKEYPTTTEYFKWKGTRFDSWCRQCYRDQEKKFREENPDLIKDRKRAYYLKEESRSLQRVRSRRWYAKHKDKVAAYRAMTSKERVEYTRQWKLAHPERAKMSRKASTQKRRGLIRQAKGNHTAKDVQLQYSSQNGLCWWCGKPVGGVYHLDHRVPLSRGGTNAANNICISCPECNLGKRDKLPHEWIGRLL